MINRKIIFLLTISFLCLFSSVKAQTDAKSKALIERASGIFRENPAFKVLFTASVAGEYENVPGTLFVSGHKYLLSIPDNEVIYDGEVRYNYIKKNNEVIIEMPDNNDRNLLSDPVALLSIADRETARYAGVRTFNGKSMETVELPESGITLYIDNGNLAAITVETEDTSFIFTILQAKVLTEVSSDMFIFDSSKYPGCEIIDFR